MAKKKKVKKRVVRGAIRANTYYVMCRAVEEGVMLGWNRAHNCGQAFPEDVKEVISTTVIDAICEYFTFNEAAS